ncbi:MAG: hypothetical protein AAF219_01460 [Myxococcota bacterium]
MFRAIGRYFRAVGYYITGNVDKARMALQTDPNVIRATYAEVVREKSGRIREYRRAVAGLVTQEEKKKHQVETLSSEVEKLEALKTGALAKAKKRAEELKKAGKSVEEIHHDEEYLKCRTAFADFSSTLNEKQARIEELEGDIGDYGDKIKKHKIQMQSLLRDLEKIKTEADEAVADMVTAKEEKEIADMLTGISEDGTAQQLSEMRELRSKAKAEARIATELAGTDTRAQEAEFLEYARTSESSSEFDALIGLAEEVETASGEAVSESKDKERLPQ